MDLILVALRNKDKALAAFHSKTKDPRMNLILVALRNKAVNFDKVLKMIDEMVTLLGKEQADDDSKKEYCESNLDRTEDEAKALAQSIVDLEKAIEESKGTIATLADEIKALIAGVKDLDDQVTEATEQRKSEHDEFVTTMANNNAAKEAAKADTEAALTKASTEKTATTAEHMAKLEEISALHGECDWLVANFETRKEARAGEIDSLKKAKAVLSGADYSLVQTRAVHAHSI